MLCLEGETILRLTIRVLIIHRCGYCQLVRIFHSKGLNNCINSMHESALRAICRDYYCMKSVSIWIFSGPSFSSK